MNIKGKEFLRGFWLIFLMYELILMILAIDHQLYFNASQSLIGMSFSCMALMYLDFKTVIITRPVVNIGKCFDDCNSCEFAGGCLDFGKNE